jgi:hypothetical protein
VEVVLDRLDHSDHLVVQVHQGLHLVVAVVVDLAEDKK